MAVAIVRALVAAAQCPWTGGPTVSSQLTYYAPVSQTRPSPRMATSLITYITRPTHLPIQEGWKAELSVLAD